MMTYLSKLLKRKDTASKRRKVKLVVPREFGLLIVTDEDEPEQLYFCQEPDDQIILASRLLTVATERKRAERED
tara:strand:+ start:29 stop:250 length:222 start_codon:yes stop_codon:yes gene_type:complete